MAQPHKIDPNMIHLGRGGTATAQPPFSGMEWYADYSERTSADGIDGRLVAMHTFSEPWDVWEVHPVGEEVVLCVGGTITLLQEHADGSTDEVTLSAGDYAINPAGTWHTADVDDSATCVFITAGMGTDHRPR